MRPILVTGGAGFIGANLADRLASTGRPVVILDNLSRAGVERNLAWLKSRHGGDGVRFRLGDVRDGDVVNHAVDGVEAVFHLAAQVAVTTSLAEPMMDFDVNTRGTLNVLEAIRRQAPPPPLVYTSTNKVYGALSDLPLVERPTRHVPRDGRFAARGVSEKRRLEFHSPYGCSKGAAEQYVLDYARSYGIPAVVFRMSCIYGSRQLGSEDQGWVAHFLRRAMTGAPITLYGDGKQVRDVLYVDDLVAAFELAIARIRTLSGRAYNLGGGPSRTLSLLELLDWIERTLRRRPPATHQAWRTGDQRYYVSDTRAFESASGWRARIGVEEGLTRLWRWLVEAQPSDATLGEASA
jgi:CDP-paratose 2-epimerase